MAGPDAQQAARARDRALARLRRVRQFTLVAAAAATLAFTVLAARAFPGHAKARPAVASLTGPQKAHKPTGAARPRHHRRPHKRHSGGATRAASAAPASPAPSTPPPAATPAPQPVAPAPQPVAPAPSTQPPVVSSGGS